MTSGNYGQMHADYLNKEYPAKYQTMSMTGDLVHYLKTVNSEAETLYLTTWEQLMKSNPAPETNDTMILAQYHNQIDSTAKEIVMNQVVYQVK